MKTWGDVAEVSLCLKKAQSLDAKLDQSCPLLIQVEYMSCVS